MATSKSGNIDVREKRPFTPPWALWLALVGVALGAVAAVLPLGHLVGTARGYIVIGVPAFVGGVFCCAILARRRVGWLWLGCVAPGAMMLFLIVRFIRWGERSPLAFDIGSGAYLGIASGAMLLLGGVWLAGRDR